MLVCVLEHLNDVHGYAPKNGMNATVLSSLFVDFVLRPRAKTSPGSAKLDESERELSRALVEEMISSVDMIIDDEAAEEFAET